MGRRSRERRERKVEMASEARRASRPNGTTDTSHSRRAAELEEDVRRLVDEEAVFWTSPACPDQLRESHLEDILAFESVDSGTSLFLGLQEHGIELPPPEKLNEQQCAEKALQVMHALADLRIFLIGFEHMSPAELYATLWRQTLWEGCYVEKRTAGAMTLIDVSHQLSHSEMQEVLEELHRSATVH